MSETKWTPGPWRGKNKTGYVYGPDCVVAVVGDFSDKELVKFSGERWAADTRLIAAAPEMYAALLEVSGMGDTMPFLRARAALARAEGRTP